VNTMSSLDLYTNNSTAAEFFDQQELPIEIKWIGTTTMDVLQAAKNAIRQGGLLLSNPLSGVRSTSQTPSMFSRPPGKAPAINRTAEPKIISINPYLSLLVSSPIKNTVDFTSVKRIDEALALYKKNARLRFLAHTEEAIKNFQTIDLQMMLVALSASRPVTRGE